MHALHGDAGSRTSPWSWLRRDRRRLPTGADIDTVADMISHRDPIEDRLGSRAPEPTSWAWAFGGILLLVAQHGNPNVGVAAWLFAIFLLRFTRAVSVLRGLIVITAVHVVAAVVWVLSIDLPTDGPPVAAALGCVALNLVLVLPYLADRLVATRLRDARPVLSTLVFPAARGGAEYLIASLSPFGLVFGMLSATQYANLSLLQLASITGGYGVSFLVAWAAPVANELWSRAPRLRPAACYAVSLIVVLAGGSLALGAYSPSPTVRVAGITPSQRILDEIALPGAAEVARSPDSGLVDRTMEPVTRELLQNTAREALAGAKVVVWSEAATRVREVDVQRLYQRVGAIARQFDIHVQLAIAMYTQYSPYGRNVTTMLGPSGEVLWEYDKTHPLAGLEPIAPGDDPVPVLSTTHGDLAGMICYDLDFGTAQVHADTVLVPAADWPAFGRLHTEKARIRAIEYGYSVVRQDADGVAAAFGPQGQLLAEVDHRTTPQQTLVAEVPIRGHRTIYSVIGDVFAHTAILLLCATAALAYRLSARSAPCADDETWSAVADLRR